MPTNAYTKIFLIKKEDNMQKIWLGFLGLILVLVEILSIPVGIGLLIGLNVIYHPHWFINILLVFNFICVFLGCGAIKLLVEAEENVKSTIDKK